MASTDSLVDELLKAGSSIIHPDEIKYVEELLHAARPNEELETRIDSLASYFRRRAFDLRPESCRTNADFALSRKHPLEHLSRVTATVADFQSDLKEGNVHAAYHSLLRFGRAIESFVDFIDLVTGHELLAALCIYNSDHFAEFFDRQYLHDARQSDIRERDVPRAPSRESDISETTKSTVSVAEANESQGSPSTVSKRGVDECMPRTVKRYYHTVVYFDHHRNTNRRNLERDALRELSNLLVRYFGEVRYANIKRSIVCEHFYKTDFDTVRALNFEAQNAKSKSFSFAQCGDPKRFIEPHLHIVHWLASRRAGVGVYKFIEEWRTKQSFNISSSSTEVRNYNALREYLHQGHGRILRFEKIFNSVEPRYADSGDKVQTSDDEFDVLLRDDDADGNFCELGGKQGSVH